MKTNNKLKQYKKIARQLKDNKLIDIDLRRTLSKADKARITRQYNQHHEIATAKKGMFVKRKLSPKRIKQFKELGYPTHNGRVYIYSKGAKSIHIKKDHIAVERKLIDENILLLKDKDILIKLEKFPKLKEGQFITSRIGNHGTWNERFDNPINLMNYIKNQFIPKAQKIGETMEERMNRKEELISHMSIVTIKK